MQLARGLRGLGRRHFTFSAQFRQDAINVQIMCTRRDARLPTFFSLSEFPIFFCFLSGGNGEFELDNCARRRQVRSAFQYANNVQKKFIVSGPFVMVGATGASLGQVHHKHCSSQQQRKGVNP